MWKIWNLQPGNDDCPVYENSYSMHKNITNNPTIKKKPPLNTTETARPSGTGP